MLSFGALNATNHEDSSSAVFHEIKKEEQESTALLIYNEALALERENSDQTCSKLEEVLNTDLILQAPQELKDGEVLSQNAALFLKYNVIKKLASLAEVANNKEKAIQLYLEAAIIDETDVTLWWKIGDLSMKVLNLRLARYSYEKGLIYSPNHWICLDKLISVLYIIGDYQACLEMISKAFEKDECYTKGFAIRNQIFKEEPHFKKDCLHLSSLYLDDEEPNNEKYQEFVEEALVIRGKRKLLAKREKASRVKVTKPLMFYSWYCLGDLLINVYNETINPEENHSLAMGVDISKLVRTSEQQDNLPVPSPDVLAKKYGKGSVKDSESVKALKRKKLHLSTQEKESEPQPKRRSTRVKLSKTKENEVNWTELVYSFLPESCRPVVAMDTDDSQDSIIEPIKNESTTNQKSMEDLRTEAIIVSNFINASAKNKNCVTLIEDFLMTLCEKWDQKWQSKMAAVYLTLFGKYRKHIHFPNAICNDDNVEYLASLAKVILLALELQLDAWLTQRNNSHTHQCSLSPYKATIASSVSKEEMTLFQSDLSYISMLAANNSLLLEDTQQFVIRFHYVHARSCIEQNLIHNAVNSFYNCLDCLSSTSREIIVLHNCQVDNFITKDAIEKMIDSVNQSQSLDELQQIFDQQKYEKIINTLSSLFADRQKGSNRLERPMQFFLLMESYHHTKSYQKCVSCIKYILDEAVQNSMVFDSWKLYLNKTLKRLNNYMIEDTDELQKSCLSQDFLYSLCEPLTKIMEFSMDNDLFIEDGQVTTLPWLLLFRIIKWKTRDQYKVKTVVESDASPIIDIEEHSNISSGSNDLICLNQPLQFLKSAHDYIGKKHWCCHDGGLLLQVLLKELFDNWKTSTGNMRETLSKDIEQCFFCLYGNPCKKSKSKSLIDHNVQPIPLVWENCKILYDFYKPEALPQLNIKTYTITVEVQHVMRKIVAVVPQRQVEVIPADKLQQYIEGGDSLPEISQKEVDDKRNGMEDLFYYLGDFYFKNKEFNKALKYYVHDISVNPMRFQSWAAMAFTRASRLEEKLNQCEMKNDSLLKKNITSTLRCFKKAVSINDKRCLILEEYGQTAYMLNSHASRKLREFHEKSKVDETQCNYYRILRSDMLLLAEKCFTGALTCVTSLEGEKWLHYYMLGKCAEKLGKSPEIFLNYYQKSLNELYQSGGKFIKKITYRSPPEYSIEAVEMFYRVHASIIKLLKYSDILDYDLLDQQLNFLNEQPIYLDIIDVDDACLKERAQDLASKQALNKSSLPEDPIRLLLDDLVDEICQAEKQPSINNEVASILNEIIDKIIDGLNSQDPSDEKQGFFCKSIEKNTSGDSFTRSMTVDDIPMISLNENASESIKEVLDLLISSVCNKFEISDLNREKTDREITEGVLNDIIDEVCLTESGCITAISSSSKKKKKISSIAESKRYIHNSKVLIQRNFKGKEKERYLRIAKRCMEGFGFCLRRFHEHYKSQYAMAHFLAKCPHSKNLQWSRDLLLGNYSEQNIYPIPLPTHGVFSGKKKTNLFQYVWRIPVHEIDRPGSFCSHNNQSISLLLSVLFELMDNSLLIHVSAFLHKTPDKERKYLRDEDRALLAIKAFDMVLEILKKRCSNKVTLKDEEIKLLFDSYEAYKHSQKMQISQQTSEYYLLKSYQRYKSSEKQRTTELTLEEAVKFCQQSKTIISKKHSNSNSNE